MAAGAAKIDVAEAGDLLGTLNHRSGRQGVAQPGNEEGKVEGHRRVFCSQCRHGHVEIGKVE